MRVRRTRLAPSPTGALHLGNARTFLINWILAKQRGWRVVLRIEDLDGPRVKSDSAAGVIETLEWMGLGWDEGPIVQSDELAPYREAMKKFAGAGVAYPCELTRAEIEEAASAPHPGGSTHDVRFPRSLRPEIRAREFDDVETNWRFVTREGTVEFVDEVAGKQSFSPAEIVGDFVLWTKRGVPSYQLAVVVDDARQGVTDVVRGDDLLDSAARQMLLYEALEMRELTPQYVHLPLVVGADGRRLAKRHGDTRVSFYRSKGLTPERLIGLLMSWSGVGDRGRPAEMSLSEAVARFDVARMAREQVVFGPEDHAWLIQK